MEIFDRIHHPDSLINRIQDKLTRVINAIARKPIVDGQLVEAELSPAPTSVPHKLGRVPNGWILLNPVSGETFGETQAPDDKFLYLGSTSSTVFTAKFWVF